LHRLQKCILFTLSLLLSPAILCAQQELIDQIETWHQPRAHYLDSVYQNFKNPSSNEQKLDAAIQLFRLFRVKEDKLEKQAQKLNVSPEEIKSWERLFTDYIETQLEKPEYRHRRLEYEMRSIYSHDDVMQLKNRLQEERSKDARLDSTLQAIWLIRKQFYLKKEGDDQKVKPLMHLALKNVPKSTDNLFLVSTICKWIGDDHYHSRQLDSAQYYYQIAAEVYYKDRSRKMIYQPYYGIHFRTEVIVSVLMNLGLVNERKGNLLRASVCYEDANKIYRNKNAEGIQWSSMRLMNAFFDMGDSASAVAQLRQLANVHLVTLKARKRYSPRFMASILAELNLHELNANVQLLDSMLAVELDYLYAEKPIESHSDQDKVDERSIYYRASLCHYNLLIHKMGYGHPESRYQLEELEYLVNTYQQESNKSTKGFTQALAMRSILLAWQVSNSKGSASAESFNKLLDIFSSTEELNSEETQALQQAIWVMNLSNYHEQELQLLKILEPVVANSAHRVSLKHVYRQLAQVHAHLGNFQEAVAYRNKHDKLAAQMQSIQQYESLAALHKKLEVAKAKSEQMQLQMENSELKARRQRLTLTIAALSIILLLGAGLFWANKRRIEARKRQLEAENQLLEAGLKSEEEKVRLASMEILKSNQSFSQLITDVENLKGDLSPENRKKVLGLLINYKTKTQDDIWQQFNLQFQSHYQSFYQNLRAQFPGLTENEQRLCAMHLSDLSNKEINAITGQKLSSIHTMKSKVRKKLGVENDDEMKAILKNLSPES